MTPSTIARIRARRERTFLRWRMLRATRHGEALWSWLLILDAAYNQAKLTEPRNKRQHP